MYKVTGTTITMVRGDSAVFDVFLTDLDGDTHVPADGDEINFYLKEYAAGDDEDPILTKKVSMASMQLVFDPADTKPFSKGRYKYDLEYVMADGFTDTFINKKVFILLEEVG